jgi:hypothetical protein
VQNSELVERIQFDIQLLVSPSFAFSTSSAVSHVGDIAHSVRVYKGRIFILVGFAVLPSQLSLTLS